MKKKKKKRHKEAAQLNSESSLNSKCTLSSCMMSCLSFIIGILSAAHIQNVRQNILIRNFCASRCSLLLLFGSIVCIYTHILGLFFHFLGCFVVWFIFLDVMHFCAIYLWVHDMHGCAIFDPTHSNTQNIILNVTRSFFIHVYWLFSTG